MKHAAVCYLVRENEGRTEVCLSKKKRGYGAGVLHGFGGVIQSPETSSQCAARETLEECGVEVSERAMRRVALVTTFTFKGEPWRVHVFRCDAWQGKPAESAECEAPQWFPVDALPLENMFPDRKYWLERALRGELLNVQAFLSSDGKEVHWEWDNDLVEALEASMR